MAKRTSKKRPRRDAPYPTVGHVLTVLAKQARRPARRFIQTKLGEWLGTLPHGRCRRLAGDVLLRLPEGWDSHAEWEIRMGDIPGGSAEFGRDLDRYLAGARRLEQEEEEGEQLWQIVYCAERWDRFSDDACRGIIAHEFAHVASGLPVDPGLEELCEDRADAIALWWGFRREQDALRKESEAFPHSSASD